MIYGIGVDTATVDRIQKSMESAAFVERFFAARERDEQATQGVRAQSLAAAFAAKEAFAKASGLGLAGFEWKQLQVLHTSTGAPYYAFEGELAAWMQTNGLCAQLSLTHEGGFATAFAVLEKADGEPQQTE